MSKEYTAFNGDAFWNDGYVQEELDMAETAVYFHYITSPRLENSGVFKEGQRMVSFYVKTDIDTVKKADEKLEKDGKIYRVGEWVIVPSSLKHQKFEKSPNAVKGIYDQLKTVPVEVLEILQKCGYILDLSHLFSLQKSGFMLLDQKAVKKRVRNSSAIKQWKKDVLKRDHYKCQKCGSNTNLHVHHIQSFVNHPELRVEVSNGITYCENCHIQWHKEHRTEK